MTLTRPSAAPARLAIVALLVCASAPPALAARARAWTSREASDYNDARFERVALSPLGRLTLAPGVERVAAVPQPVVWCLAVDSEGRLHAGGGNDGQVIRLDGERAEVIFDAPEVEVHALAFDERGRLYAGTSPDGRVYRIEKGAEVKVFFDPEATYIWATQFDSRKRLIVATGQPGRLYRVGPDGESEVLLDSREDHIRTLVPDGRGGFLAGSDGGGVVFAIDPDGAVRVLYDSPEREIAALAVVDGFAYAAALSPARKGQPGAVRSETHGNVTTVRVTADGGVEEGEGDEDDEEDPPRNDGGQRRPQPQETYAGSVYRISQDGYARKVWSSDARLPLALLAAPEGGLLVGTGGGRILSLTSQGDAVELAAVESEQVSAFVDGGARGVFAATSNLGAIFRLREGFATEGTILGGVRDAGFTSRWGALAWEAEVPSSTEILFEVRSGHTEVPDATWSGWSGPYRTSGDVISSPPARFIQWKATLRSGSSGASPVIRSSTGNYLPDNMPPEVESVEILDPGVWLQSTQSGRSGEGAEARGRRASQPKRAAEHGMRSVQWTATDANDDPLQAVVFFRGENEREWRILAEGLEEPFHAWDTTAMPDGVYRLRVIVSDAPGNPPGLGITSARESAAFEVDNTPPLVGEIVATSASRSLKVTASVTDSFSVIEEIAWSIDAGAWMLVMPEDGVADSTRESVRFATGDLAPGEHTIVIRARDRAGNISAGKTVVVLR